jgi:general secretion pathway protein C
MSARWMTFLIWALVAATLVGWGLRLFVVAPGAPPDVRVADASLALRGDLTRVLGADPPPAAPDAEAEADGPAPDARFQLVGVVAPRAAAVGRREGVALIAVDGLPPKAYRVGARVDQQTVLKAVRTRGADLGPRDGPATIALEIAPPAPAATGTLPAAASGRMGAAPAAPDAADSDEPTPPNLPTAPTAPAMPAAPGMPAVPTVPGMPGMPPARPGVPQPLVPAPKAKPLPPAVGATPAPAYPGAGGLPQGSGPDGLPRS